VLERLQCALNGQEWHITIALLIGAVQSAVINPALGGFL
jgi:hypothetical protein